MPLPSTGPISINDISSAFYKPAQTSAQTLTTEQADPQSLGFNFTVLNFASQSAWPEINVLIYKLYSGNPGYYGYWLYIDSELIPITTAQGDALRGNNNQTISHGNQTYQITPSGSTTINYFSADGSTWTDISVGTAVSIAVTRSISASSLYQIRSGVSPVGQLHSGFEFNPRDPNYGNELWPIRRNNVSLTYDSTNSKYLLAVSYGSMYYNSSIGYKTRIYILTPTSGSIGFTNQYVDIIVNNPSTGLYMINSADLSYGAIKIHFHTGCNKIMLLCQGESQPGYDSPTIILKVGTLSYTGSTPTFTWQSTTTLSPSTNNNQPPTLDLQQHPTEANKALILYKINRFGNTPWVLKPITVATNGSITLGVETTVQAGSVVHAAELLFAQQNAFVIRAFNQNYVANIELTTGVYTIGSTDAQDSVSVDSTTIVSTSAAHKDDNQKGTIFIPDKNLYIIAYHKTGNLSMVRPFSINSSTRAITLGVETQLPTMTGTDTVRWLSLGFRSDLNLPCIIISRQRQNLNPNSGFFEAQSFDIVQHPTDASLNTISPRALHTDTSSPFEMPSRNQILFDAVKRHFLVVGSADVLYGYYYAKDLFVYEGHKPLSFTNYRSVTAVPQIISVSLESGADSVTNVTSASVTINARDDDAITHYVVRSTTTTPAAGDADWLTWPVSTSFTWTAEALAGTYTRTAYVWVKDAQGNVSNMGSDSINYIVVFNPPANNSFTLQSNAASITDSTTVTLEMDATNATTYFVSEINSTPSASDNDWYSYSTSGKNTILSGSTSTGTFSRTVYIWFKSAQEMVQTTPLSDSINYINSSGNPTYAVNAWFCGGYTSGNTSFHKMSFASMSNGIRNGQLTTSLVHTPVGGSNHYKMIASCYNTYTNSDIKDLSSNSNATTHGTLANAHTTGMADGNSTVLMYHSGYSGGSPPQNTGPQTKQSYASASSSTCGTSLITSDNGGTRHGYLVCDYNNTTVAGAGDSNSYRHATSWETSISSCSVSSVGGLPQVMYVMEGAGNANYACISGSYGNYPYQHLGKIDRYSYASNSFTNQWLSITATHGFSVSDRNDTCFHGKGSGTGWEKFSISSGGTKTDIGNGGNKGSICRGSGV